VFQYSIQQYTNSVSVQYTAEYKQCFSTVYSSIQTMFQYSTQIVFQYSIQQYTNSVSVQYRAVYMYKCYQILFTFQLSQSTPVRPSVSDCCASNCADFHPTHDSRIPSCAQMRYRSLYTSHRNVASTIMCHLCSQVAHARYCSCLHETRARSITVAQNCCTEMLYRFSSEFNKHFNHCRPNSRLVVAPCWPLV